VIVVVAVPVVGGVVPVGFVAVGTPVWVPVAVGVVAPAVVVATSGAPQADTRDNISTRIPSTIAQYPFFMFVLLLYILLFLLHFWKLGWIMEGLF
jgi:L-lactate permease